MARKQMARSLPPEWDVAVTFAGHGGEALAALQAGKGDILFLDLTMPVMDGYETLEAIREQGLNTMVVVVSGDIQEQARQRVIGLGAMDFLKKPVSKEVVEQLLSQFGILQVTDDQSTSATAHQPTSPTITIDNTVTELDSASTDHVNPFDCYREITNVAVGRAGDLLARLTGEFVRLPIPKVAMLEPSELQMALAFADDDSVQAVCQGFIARGIAGEALLLFSDSSFASMAKLMKHNSVGVSAQLEVLTDVSGALLGAILNGLGEQLDLSFSQGYPTILGCHCHVSELIAANSQRWQQTLTIEVTYTIENYDIFCDVLLLFTPSSLTAINARLDYFLNGS